ncbi:hypothetical protein KUV65_00630 [Maritalea mobilis]|uniref:hypothetical protein n=1 Tax=Maritalea mobilis TaxID=483324 RepID=UPI001C9768BC|nr:hypothetical protein [Maritalea mobilis]MBY6199853.1 hypothetical protein [Maritalea mobilis]
MRKRGTPDRQTRAAVAACAFFLATPAQPQPLACPDSNVLVEGAGEDTGRICAIVAATQRQFDQCGGLTIPEDIEIAINPDLGLNCVGLYHCGEHRIELLPPDTYNNDTAMSATGEFSMITPGAYFESVLRHELAHAAMDDLMECPLPNCLVGQEYVAYALQIEFLPASDRDAFLATQPEVARPISRDELHPMILFMAPGLFARKAWLHFRDRPDPCGFLGQVARGEVLLDYEHF